MYVTTQDHPELAGGSLLSPHAFYRIRRAEFESSRSATHRSAVPATDD